MARSKYRRWADLRRRPPWREVKPRILVVCEGTVTEPRYFEDLRRKERAALVEIVIDGDGGEPKTLVERAVERKKQAERDAERYRDDNRRFDAVWCVFDVDEHPRLADARQQARDNGIELAVSNPCFELWALLHLQEQNAHVSRHQTRQRLKKHLRAYDKELPFEQIDAHYQQAVRRAEALDKRHQEIDEPGTNPSTGVYRLTERIRRAKG